MMQKTEGAAISMHFQGKVRRQPYRGPSVGDRSCDSLANPPSRIGRKPQTEGMVEFLSRANETKNAFLNKVICSEVRHAEKGACDMCDQTQIS
ncbi:hypothetical protein RSK60_160009 [Ralstonia solanacearum K60]|nr:hypothetical protein RSK60_160009 [Ralstonia solanacearum K60]